MEADKLKLGLIQALSTIDVSCGVVDVEQLAVVQSLIQVVTDSGEVDFAGQQDNQQFQTRYVKIFRGEKYDFDYRKVMFAAKCVLVFAIRIPVHQVGFTVNGRVVDVVIPPDYLNQSRVEQVKYTLDAWLVAHGYHYQPAKLPLKMLAVGSGLAQYGRNNLVYVDNMGSRLYLLAYYTDAALPCDAWRGLVRMNICDQCGNCVKHCPTQALSLDRRIVKAERCLALYNEDPLELPSWIEPTAHNALIGCIRCEERCPVNLCYDNQLQELPMIDEETTQEIINAQRIEDLSVNAYQRLATYEMVQYFPVLRRNLMLLTAIHKEDA